MNRKIFVSAVIIFLAVASIDAHASYVEYGQMMYDMIGCPDAGSMRVFETPLSPDADQRAIAAMTLNRQCVALPKGARVIVIYDNDPATDGVVKVQTSGYPYVLYTMRRWIYIQQQPDADSFRVRDRKPNW